MLRVGLSLVDMYVSVIEVVGHTDSSSVGERDLPRSRIHCVELYEQTPMRLGRN